MPQEVSDGKAPVVHESVQAGSRALAGEVRQTDRPGRVGTGCAAQSALQVARATPAQRPRRGVSGSRAAPRPRRGAGVPSACPRGSRGAKWSEVLSRFSVSARRHHAITCRGSRIFTGSLVSWPLSRAAQARPGPFPPDGGKAIAMMHNPRASGLSRAMWPPQGSAVLPAGPDLQPSQASLVGKEDINARPHFRWGAALEVVMRSEMVVPPANLQQVDGKLRAIVYGCLREGGLHRADEALDAAILPGTAGIRALRRDAQEPQCQSEPSRGEDRFVVCAQELRRAIPPERADEM